MTAVTLGTLKENGPTYLEPKVPTCRHTGTVPTIVFGGIQVNDRHVSIMVQLDGDILRWPIGCVIWSELFG